MPLPSRRYVLREHLHIEMEGDFQQESLFEILVHAAPTAQSVEQTCKTLEHTPTGNDVRYHLNKLENLEALEGELNGTLGARVPGRLENSRQKLAIDLNRIPYYGPPSDEELPDIKPGQIRNLLLLCLRYTLRHLPRQADYQGEPCCPKGRNDGLCHHAVAR
jgi:hypothetical protein